MIKHWKNVISEALGVTPVLINSGLVSAQNRRRLYWTNIEITEELEDKKLYWTHIREHNAENVYYVTEKMRKWIHKDPQRSKRFKIYDENEEKMQMLERSHYKGISNQRCFAIKDTNGLRYISPIECERLHKQFQIIIHNT